MTVYVDRAGEHPGRRYIGHDPAPDGARTRIRLGLLGYHSCWEDVAFAERHGFATAGFVDSPLLGGETFACMALAAQATSTIRLGPFLAVPSNRSAATTAQGVATVNRLAPGRVFLALGTGYTSRNTFGLRALPATRMRDSR